MRPYFLALAIFAASANPAPAQVDPNAALRDAEIFSQQQSAQQRSIDLNNRLSTLEAQVGTNQRLRELDQQQARHAPAPSIPSLGSSAGSPKLGGYASIPDDRLAASNARVREASRNRR